MAIIMGYTIFIRRREMETTPRSRDADDATKIKAGETGTE